MYSSYNRSFKDYPVKNSDYADQNNFLLEHAPGHGESYHDDGHHRHQLDEDVQAMTSLHALPSLSLSCQHPLHSGHRLSALVPFPLSPG